MQNLELRKAEERRAIEGARQQRATAIKSDSDAVRYREEFRLRKRVTDVSARVVRGFAVRDPDGRAEARREQFR
jgi:hypothetical protein